MLFIFKQNGTLKITIVVVGSVCSKYSVSCTRSSLVLSLFIASRPHLWTSYHSVSVVSSTTQISHFCSRSPLVSTVSLAVGRHCPLLLPSLLPIGIAWLTSLHGPNSSLTGHTTLHMASLFYLGYGL